MFLRYSICILFTILQFLPKSTPKDITCDYTLIRFSLFTNIYRCEVKSELNITSKHSGVITSSSGNHTADKSNNDVACFVSYGNYVQYFPQNLQNIFRNLKRISIQDGRLKEINQDDIKPFPQLTELHLMNNDLMVLEDGLFEYNSELTLIDLSSNEILHIGQYVFDGLTKLTFLDIKLCLCINMSADRDKEALGLVIKQAKDNCTNSEFVAIKKNLKELEDEYVYIVNATYEPFKVKAQKFQEIYENSSFMNLSSISETINAFLDIATQPAWLAERKLKELEKTMMQSNRNILKKIEGMEKKPNLIEIATSSTRMWIAVVLVIIVFIFIYRKTSRCQIFPNVII